MALSFSAPARGEMAMKPSFKHKTLLQMDAPTRRSLTCIQHYIACDEFGIQYRAGIERDDLGSYDDPDDFKDDLVCLQTRGRQESSRTGSGTTV
ncbi:hypothetical protein M011DRAFT_485647 [Sporormia fimetaria CBS 119925]|uniref:Uncharacterized protein n=1 Tax=Sporormia fimetaria CBS 119925 TaxID=1340428 RepID=A0A6A6VGX9_9PLEO|nr:hypothetical protein M011DRAFT_485647 [Sporormia fimetaria CBS 119925]